MPFRPVGSVCRKCCGNKDMFRLTELLNRTSTTAVLNWWTLCKGVLILDWICISQTELQRSEVNWAILLTNYRLCYDRRRVDLYLGVRSQTGAHYQILITFRQLLVSWRGTDLVKTTLFFFHCWKLHCYSDFVTAILLLLAFWSFRIMSQYIKADNMKLMSRKRVLINVAVSQHVHFPDSVVTHSHWTRLVFVMKPVANCGRQYQM
jgi:hypothetical protein